MVLKKPCQTPSEAFLIKPVSHSVYAVENKINTAFNHSRSPFKTFAQWRSTHQFKFLNKSTEHEGFRGISHKSLVLKPFESTVLH